jgi:Xaa-Pro dipeptidase
MRPTDPTSTISAPTRTRYGARLDRLRKIAQEAGYDAVAIVPGPSLLYLTHVSYHLSERPIVLIVPAVGDPAMIIPLLELPKITDAAPFPIQCFGYSDADGYLSAFEQACKALGLDGKNVGVEGLKMRVLEGELIQRYARGSRLTSADSAIIRLRLHKEQDELASMRRAIKISEAGLEETLAEVKVGMTERQITNILLNRMAAHDGGGNAFDPIVLTGPKTAQPHGVPGDRALQKGELLLFDFGSIVDGYPADITRTFFVGEPDAELRRVYELVLAANSAGIGAIRPGVIAQDVDRTARKIIADAGYGEYFMHRLGHGLGLDVHEEPNIREGNTQKLEPGMVFTIEPGIYLPGKGGVRIEDNVVVTENGVEVLTSFPKPLRVISA